MMKILVLDIGGTKVKALVTGESTPRKMPSGTELTPDRLVEGVRELAKDWSYEALSIGYPGMVRANGPHSEPGNLGPGWVGFNFAAAFDRPVRIINDAAMQALGSYEGGRMLFLGLGTGLGSTLIADNVIVPLELGRLQRKGKQTWGETLSRQGLKQRGKTAWLRDLGALVTELHDAFLADYVVLGGGNAKRLKQPDDLKNLPPGVRLGGNLTAFRGGFRLWGLEDVATLSATDSQLQTDSERPEWRLL
jgi:polyphosphate glucokinase